MFGHDINREDAVRQHPLRAAILTLLAEDGPLSAPEIRVQISKDPSLGAVAYHLRILEETDLVGATDGYYELL